MESFFIQPLTPVSFLAASLVGVLCGALGPYLVWKRLGLVGDAVSHASLTVIAIALALGLSETALLIPFAIVLGLVMAALQDRKFEELDSVIALFFAGFLGLGLIIMRFSGKGSEEVLHALFGDITKMQELELVLLAAVTIVVLLYLVRFRNELRLTLTQPDLAKIQGISVKKHSTVLLILISVTVAICLKLMGVVLVTALFVAPALIAMSFARSAQSHAILSMIFGLVLAVGGLALSQVLSLPGSATIAALSLLIFMLTAILRGRA